MHVAEEVLTFAKESDLIPAMRSNPEYHVQASAEYVNLVATAVEIGATRALSI